MWAWIYDGRYGVANDLLMRLGLIVPFFNHEHAILQTVAARQVE